MKKAKDIGGISGEQYDIRKQYSADYKALNNVIFFDRLQMLRVF